MDGKTLGYRLAQWLSTTLSNPTAFRLAERLADIQWRCSAKDRAAVQANVSMLLGQRIPPEAPVVREVFRSFGRYLVEFFTIHQVPQPQVTLEGVAHLQEVRRQRRGAIVVTAHLGNWEVGAVLLHRMGFAVAAVALPHGDPTMDRLFNGQRTRCGIEVIPLGRAAAQRSLQRLREGALLGILGDREFGTHGLAVAWAGQRVRLPRGPATLSLRSRCPLIPTFLVREGPWKFRLCVEPPLRPERAQVSEGGIEALTEAYAAVMAGYLKRFPEQWLMFQPVAVTG